MGIAPAEFVHPFFLPPDYLGMNDMVQLLNAIAGLPGWNFESQRGQALAIDLAIRLEYAAAEMAYHFAVNRQAGLHQLMGEAVGLQQMRSECNQHLPDSG